jgi:uncharacterized phage-like protein YoqJ
MDERDPFYYKNKIRKLLIEATKNGVEFEVMAGNIGMTFLDFKTNKKIESVFSGHKK